MQLTGENKDEDEHDGGVTEIEDGRSETLHLEFGEIEVYWIYEEVDGSAAGRQVASPPPPVILQQFANFVSIIFIIIKIVI